MWRGFALVEEASDLLEERVRRFRFGRMRLWANTGIWISASFDRHPRNTHMRPSWRS